MIKPADIASGVSPCLAKKFTKFKEEVHTVTLPVSLWAINTKQIIKQTARFLLKKELLIFITTPLTLQLKRWSTKTPIFHEKFNHIKHYLMEGHISNQ